MEKPRSNAGLFLLEKDLSCQFFLISCRILSTDEEGVGGRLDDPTLDLWEKMLFTRDFHERYYRRTHRDDFSRLFHEIISGAKSITSVHKIINVLTRKDWGATKM